MAESKNQSHAFVGNGKVYLTPVKNGVDGKPFWVGVAPAATINQSVEDKKTMKEYHSGNVGDWDTVDGGVKTTMKITLSERRPDAMKAALQATETKVSTGNAEAEEHAVSEVGDIIFLKHKNVTAITAFKDSTTTTALDLVEGVDYKLDKQYGTIELLEKQTLKSPLKVTYSYGAATELKPMTDDVDYYKVRINGLNRAGQKDKQVIEGFRGKIAPADALDLINDDFSKMDLEIDLLMDEAEGAPYKITQI